MLNVLLLLFMVLVFVFVVLWLFDVPPFLHISITLLCNSEFCLNNIIIISVKFLGSSPKYGSVAPRVAVEASAAVESDVVFASLHMTLCLYILVRHLNNLEQEEHVYVLETYDGFSGGETHFAICFFLVK
jgi:hypothetical protein